MSVSAIQDTKQDKTTFLDSVFGTAETFVNGLSNLVDNDLVRPFLFDTPEPTNATSGQAGKGSRLQGTTNQPASGFLTRAARSSVEQNRASNAPVADNNNTLLMVAGALALVLVLGRL